VPHCNPMSPHCNPMSQTLLLVLFLYVWQDIQSLLSKVVCFESLLWKVLWYTRIFIYKKINYWPFTRVEIFHISNKSPLDTTWTYLWSCASPTVDNWLLVHPTTLTFHLSLTHFLTTLHTHPDSPHPIIAHLSHCQVELTIYDLSIHLLWCLCKGEHIVAYNILQDIITTILL
jgi:hypothetical protein